MSQNQIGSIPPHFGGKNPPKIFETNFLLECTQAVCSSYDSLKPSNPFHPPLSLGGERRDNEALKSLVCVFLSSRLFNKCLLKMTRFLCCYMNLSLVGTFSVRAYIFWVCFSTFGMMFHSWGGLHIRGLKKWMWQIQSFGTIPKRT